MIGPTIDNLAEAAAGEDHETTTMYPEFAAIAKEEGFGEIASVLKNIAVAEKRHRDEAEYCRRQGV